MVESRILVRRLRAALAAEAGEAETHWAEAAELYAASAWEDAALGAAIETRDRAAIQARVADWEAGRQPLPPPDRASLKRALKAFRKRLKLLQLDDESGLGGGPFSKGSTSSIVAIRAPEGYPDEVWDELVHQGRLREDSPGSYALLGE